MGMKKTWTTLSAGKHLQSPNGIIFWNSECLRDGNSYSDGVIVIVTESDCFCDCDSDSDGQ